MFDVAVHGKPPRLLAAHWDHEPTASQVVRLALRDASGRGATGATGVHSPFAPKSVMRVINLEAGHPDLETARRRLLTEMATARREGTRVLKVIHGWGSSGAGGVLCAGIRKSLRLRVKEGKALAVIAGERFSGDTNEGRELAQRYPAVRGDRDFNRMNPGVTIVELAL